MVTSAANPSAPSAAAEKEVAMEKKITVPPGAVASRAPPSTPATSTQTTGTSAAGCTAAGATARGLPALAARHRIAAVDHDDLVGQPAGVDRRCLVDVRDGRHDR